MKNLLHLLLLSSSLVVTACGNLPVVEADSSFCLVSLNGECKYVSTSASMSGDTRSVKFCY